MRIARFLWLIFLGLTVAIGVQALLVAPLAAPEDLPWTPLDLRAPPGLFTAGKLARLRTDPGLCRALLRRAEVPVVAVPPLRRSDGCGWTDAVRLTAAGRPHVPLSCPLAAALEVWMSHVVQPAAVHMLGSRVVRVEQYGSYACRPIRGGGAAAALSEHATANAIDVSGFRLADGRHVTIARGWRRGPHGRFLHAIRDRGCRVFATTLSPDYNAAHHDHLHLDEAARGMMGWSACD